MSSATLTPPKLGPNRPIDIRRKPPYPSRPIFRLRPAKVTTAVGVVSLDGSNLILATDSKYTAHVTYPGEKVFPLPPRDHFRVVIAAAANDAGFMKSAIDKINDALPRVSKPLPMDEIVRLIEEQESTFYKRHILPLAKAKVEDYRLPEHSFLIAIWCAPHQLQLLKSYKGIISHVDKYEFIGAGGLIAQTYEQRMGQYRTDEFEAGLLALYWVKQAKASDPDSGGDTYLYVLSESGKLNRFDSVYVDCAEKHFAQLERLFDSIVIPPSVGDRDMLEAVLDENLRGDVSNIKRYRQDLLRMYDAEACYRRIWPPRST